MLVNLIAEMKRFGVSSAQVAETIGRSERAAKNRLYGSVDITSDDLKKIRDRFFPFYTMDYLLSESPVIVSPAETNRPA